MSNQTDSQEETLQGDKCCCCCCWIWQNWNLEARFVLLCFVACQLKRKFRLQVGQQETDGVAPAGPSLPGQVSKRAQRDGEPPVVGGGRQAAAAATFSGLSSHNVLAGWLTNNFYLARGCHKQNRRDFRQSARIR